MAVMLQPELFRVVMPCCIVVDYQLFGGAEDLWNVVTLPQHYTASQLWRWRQHGHL